MPVPASRRLDRAQVEDLPGEVPVVKRLRGVDALVALKPDQRDAQAERQRLGQRRLSGARLPFEQQRPVQPQGEEADRRQGVVAEVPGACQGLRQARGRGHLIRGEHGDSMAAGPVKLHCRP